MGRHQIARDLKKMIIERVQLEIEEDELRDDQPLFGSEEGSLGLDSIEALEIAVGIEHTFEVKVDESEETATRFYSVATLSEYIEELLEARDRSE